MGRLGTRVRDAAFRDPVAYLTVLFVGIPLAQFARVTWPTVAVLGDVPLGHGIEMLAALMGLLLWAGCRTWSTARAARGFVGLMFALWAFVMVSSIVAKPMPDVDTLTVGAMLVMLLTKPPDRWAARRVADLLAWAVAFVCVASITLESLGLVQSWYGRWNATEILTLERETYWIRLGELLGLDGRWAGPFVHPNRAGPIGAFLLIYGVCRTGINRIVFATAGILVLLTAASRTSFIGAVAGLAAMGAARWLGRPGWLPRPWRVAAVTTAVLAFAAIWVVPNPGLTGRASAWPTYVALWREQPWTGIGGYGIGEATANGVLPSWAYHAHNTVLDATTRYGVGALVLVLLVLGSALMITSRAALRGWLAGIGLAVMIVVAGMGHTIVAFKVPEVALTVLLLAVLTSVDDPRSSESPIIPGQDASGQTQGLHELGSGGELGAEKAIGTRAGDIDP